MILHLANLVIGAPTKHLANLTNIMKLFTAEADAVQHFEVHIRINSADYYFKYLPGQSF